MRPAESVLEYPPNRREVWICRGDVLCLRTNFVGKFTGPHLGVEHDSTFHCVSTPLISQCLARSFVYLQRHPDL